MSEVIKTEKVNIAALLKYQSRWVKRMTEVDRKIREIVETCRYQSSTTGYAIDSPTTFDSEQVKRVEDLLAELNKISFNLAAIRTYIGIANIELLQTLNELHEKKSLHCRVTNYTAQRWTNSERLDDGSKLIEIRASYLLPEQKEKILSELSAEIDQLQDKIDAYNGVTLIDLPVDLMC